MLYIALTYIYIPTTALKRVLTMVLDVSGGWINTFMQKCDRCSTMLQYGTNTKFDRELEAHICTSCGEVLR